MYGSQDFRRQAYVIAAYGGGLAVREQQRAAARAAGKQTTLDEVVAAGRGFARRAQTRSSGLHSQRFDDDLFEETGAPSEPSIRELLRDIILMLLLLGEPVILPVPGGVLVMIDCPEHGIEMEIFPV